MRILLVSRFYWPSPGGHTTVLRDLARSWADDGNQVLVLTTQHNTELTTHEELNGVRVLRLRVFQKDYLTILDLLWQLRRFLRAHGSTFDVICVSMLKHCALAAVQYASGSGRKRVPVILRTEGGGPTGDVAWQDRALFGSYIRGQCQAANAIVALTGEIEKELHEAAYPPERVRCIPNGVRIPTMAWSSDKTHEHRRSLGLSDRPTLCFAGRLIREKGLLELIDALAHLRAVGIDLQLLLVGDGRDRPTIEEHARRLDVRDSLQLVGQVRDVEVYLRASDLFVLPSYVEGMSRALLESLALGMPTLASDIEANRQLAPENLLWRCPIRDGKGLARAIRARLESSQIAAIGVVGATACLCE